MVQNLQGLIVYALSVLPPDSNPLLCGKANWQVVGSVIWANQQRYNTLVVHPLHRFDSESAVVASLGVLYRDRAVVSANVHFDLPWLVVSALHGYYKLILVPVKW